MSARPDPLEAWLADLESRHLALLSFAEVRRGIQALSSLYVERRSRMKAGATLDGNGKRAAFALFYAPLHFLLVREIVRALGTPRPGVGRLLDLGCGTGSAGAAWALELPAQTSVLGIDRSGWAVEEARHTYRSLRVRATASRGALEGARLDAAHVLAAFAINELDPVARAGLLDRFMEAAERGASILVVEPIARSQIPWWAEWRTRFARSGGRDDEWRFPVDLPPLLRRLDEAAGLDHGELTGRSLFLSH